MWTFDNTSTSTSLGDKHPVLGDGEFEHVFVFETFEILLGVEGPDVVPTIP